MDNQEAKFILSAYRTAGQDANDPRFAEALAQARRDPILEHWFQESAAFDVAMTEKLRVVPVPSDLREGILAGVKVSRVPRWKNRLRKWAIAAAVILSATLGGLIWHNTRPSPRTGWQLQALDVISSLVRQESSFDAQSHDARDLLAWLRANHAPAAERLPANIEKLQSLGCKTFSWKGLPVSVICFTGPDGGLIHLVMTSARRAPDRWREGKPQLIQRAEWATATWREGNTIYMLAMEGSRDELRAFLL